jgi:hypothetical protein
MFREDCFYFFAVFRDWHASCIDPCTGPRMKSGPAKGRLEMSAQSHFTRTLVAFAAALLVSSVTVGAAVGPAQVAANPTVSARA